jgi:type II secretory ATPase GspE/PulE/Tfp pilus assembly ATPase PilB-like protein
VNQIQVSEKSGLTFARGLRSILRHDPDIVLIGEIRDQETAQIAVQASLTGHLVFSTLHTNDAAGALTRLVDMGVEPYLVASSLEAVLAQRLVRLLCPHCKQVDTTPEAGDYKLRIGIRPEARVYRAVGCRECRHTGYHGRRAIFEWMDSSSEIRSLILKNGSTDAIRNSACRAGMKTLAEDGRRLVEEGVTTIEEVLSVTTVHEMETTEAKPPHAAAPHAHAPEPTLPRSLI